MRIHSASGSSVGKYQCGIVISLQLLYLTHHPASRAIAAICLAARDVDIEAIVEWREVLGTNEEELENLVAGLESCEG